MESKIKDKRLKTKGESKKVVKSGLKDSETNSEGHKRGGLLKDSETSSRGRKKVGLLKDSETSSEGHKGEGHKEGCCGKEFFSWRIKKPFGVVGIVFGILLITYSIILIFAREIETIATFPGMLDKSAYNIIIDLDYKVINIDDGEGNNINGIYVEGVNGKTVYYFHGNVGPIELFFDEIKYINDLGYNVMAYDYPGYGTSTGFPYKRNVDNFSDKFFKYIQKEKGLKSEDLILWGYSVGTAIAVDFALKNDFDKIVLVAPFSSRYDFARDKLGFVLQIFLFLEDSYITRNLVENFESPALIIHGNKDEVVPFLQGKLVYYSYAFRKYFIELDNFGHNGILRSYGNSLKNIFKNFIDFGTLEFEKNYLFLGKDEKIKLEEENKRIEFENSIDLFTDSSIEKFVTSTIPFNDMNYIPENLVTISSEYISDLKGGYQTLRKEAKDALDNLGKAFYEQFNMKIGIVSAYRSYEYQKVIKVGCGDTWCAKPGYSEHQTGLVVDIFEASSEGNWRTTPSLMKYYLWLVKNSHLYGWHNTYQKGVAIDGYEIEPWHWRYLGVEFATYLYENNMTIAEYAFTHGATPENGLLEVGGKD